MQPVLLYEENECKAVDSGMPKELTCLDHISADKQKSSCSGADQFFLFAVISVKNPLIMMCNASRIRFLLLTLPLKLFTYVNFIKCYLPSSPLP
jgi:hypothetical protein